MPTLSERSRKGAVWLAQRQEQDGSIGAGCGARGFYKSTLALVRAGLPDHANRLLNWIKKHAMPGPGIIVDPGESKVTGNESLYRSLWTLRGALTLGRLDVASDDAIAHVMAHQVSTGGFKPFLRGNGHQVIDPTVTSLAGWLLLDIRLLEPARQAGAHLLRLLDLQPEGSTVFYYRFDVDRGELVRTAPAGNELTIAIDPADSRQLFFHLGAPMGFLSDLYRATNDRAYLRGAERYFAWSSKICDGGCDWPPVCKNGWGAALLYSVTQNPAHRMHAEEIARRTFVEPQAREGNWPGLEYNLTPDMRVALPPEEITAEFTFELLEIAKGLAA